jgi:hypothetical protein
VPLAVDLCEPCYRGMHYTLATWHTAAVDVRCGCGCGDAPHPSELWDARACDAWHGKGRGTWSRYALRFPPGSPGGTPAPVREVRGRRLWRAVDVARWAPPQGWRRNKRRSAS